jgi:AraC-like DNA-binding protein
MALPLQGIFRFSPSQSLDHCQHDETDIILYRMLNGGEVGTMAYANRDADGPDLLFLSRGGGKVASGKLAGTPFEIAPNTDLRATYTPHGADSHITFGASARSTNLVFPRGYLAGLMVGQSHGSFAPLMFSDDDRLARLIRLLEAEIIAPGFASRLLVDGIGRAIATLLVRLDPASIAAGHERIYLPPRKVRRVIDFIEANLDRDIGLADLARVAELSPFHFSRVFKLATGASPYHFVRERRLQRSRRMLLEDNLGIAEIAIACGFASQSHMTAAFTKAMGISPGRYRCQARD